MVDNLWIIVLFCWIVCFFFNIFNILKKLLNLLIYKWVFLVKLFKLLIVVLGVLFWEFGLLVFMLGGKVLDLFFFLLLGFFLGFV